MAEEKNKKEPTLEELENKIKELDVQKTEYLAGWQRERADFLNYKKEEMERIGQLIGYAREELILEILPIMDNFDVATRLRSEDDGASARQGKNDKTLEGFAQIKIQLQDFLKKLGVEEIKSLGDPPSHEASDGQGKFDPKYMEVVEEVEMEGKESGTIIETVQKGYMINGHLLRPARVKVVK